MCSMRLKIRQSDKTRFLVKRAPESEHTTAVPTTRPFRSSWLLLYCSVPPNCNASHSRLDTTCDKVEVYGLRGKLPQLPRRLPPIPEITTTRQPVPQWHRCGQRLVFVKIPINSATSARRCNPPSALPFFVNDNCQRKTDITPGGAKQPPWMEQHPRRQITSAMPADIRIGKMRWWGCCVCRQESARWRDGSGGEVQEWDEDPSGGYGLCRNVLVLLERGIKGVEVLSVPKRPGLHSESLR